MLAGRELRNTEVSSGRVVNDRFEWDERKAAQNERKHRIPFEIAEQVFDDELHATRIAALAAREDSQGYGEARTPGESMADELCRASGLGRARE